jgi:hypothetical protein
MEKAGPAFLSNAPLETTELAQRRIVMILQRLRPFQSMEDTQHAGSLNRCSCALPGIGTVLDRRTVSSGRR